MYEKYLSSVNVTEKELERNFSQNVDLQKEIVANLPQDKEAKIIDLGCGYGTFLNALSKLGYKNLHGVEIGKEQNKFLNKKGFKVYKQDLVEFLKTSEEKFDCITLFDVLEHFKKDEIVEIVSLLKDRLKMGGGVIMVRVPNGEAIFKGSIMYGDFTHETFFTKISLIQVFKTLGFKDVEVYPVYEFGKTWKAKIAKFIYLSYVKFYKLLLRIDNGASLEYFVPSQNILGVVR
jgi:2-polyprenyl-3-methyl-5-hydroxy-6-metoxy-1,4-benzoquinol methylase